MKQKKKTYLRLDNRKRVTVEDIFSGSFFKSLRINEMGMSFKAFLAVSVGSGILLYLIYLYSTRTQFLAIEAGILGLSVPYFMTHTNMMLNKAVADALAYKEFITVLQSGLRASNSTAEALIIAAEDDALAPKIKELMTSIATRLKMGDSVENVLEDEAAKAKNTHVKMALTFIRINHEIGTSVTMDALDNIQRDMDNVIENVQLLHSKVGDSLHDKKLFMILALACPLLRKIFASSVAEQFYTVPVFVWIYAVIILFVFVGQAVLEYMSYRTIKNM